MFQTRDTSVFDVNEPPSDREHLCLYTNELVTNLFLVLSIVQLNATLLSQLIKLPLTVGFEYGYV